MKLRHFFGLLATLFALTGFWGCVDLEFDEPPVRELPALTANTTVQAVKDMHVIGQNANLIDEDLIVSGVVVADDESGNFYQQIIFEDATGGIAIRLGTNGLYTLYPVGTEVFVKMKGLYVGDYNGFYQISGDVDGGVIASPLVPEHVVAGEKDKVVTPTPADLDELLSNSATFDGLLSRLIVLDGVQFAGVDLGDTYAVAGGGSGQNRTIEDCLGNSITLRNSDFSDFAGEPINEMNGSLTAILSVFGTTPQLVIRDLGDVNFTDARCGSQGQGGNLISIQTVREAFAGGATTGPADSKVRGIVISDRTASNINGRNVVIQDGTAGILVRFASNHSFDLGEEIEVTVADQELSEYNGLLQVNNVPLGLASSNGMGTLPTPRTATVAEVLANGDAWESTLVYLADVTLSGNSVFSGNVDVSDGTGTLPLFSYSSADFANDVLPAGTGNLTAIISDFNGIQINLRNGDDIDFDGTGGDPTMITAAELRTLFEGGASAAPGAKILRGVVISDVDNGNLTERNVVLQDETGGIVIRFTANHSFALGEEIEVNVSNQELSEYNGLLQVNNVPNANATSFGNGTLPTPAILTIAEIVADLENLESTLVQIEGVSFTEGGTYSGTKMLDDGTGQIEIYTRTQASFANSTAPSG
ncbi:MAG: nuclease, partial [Lewinella sp.]|nr:nuclease [Lewinella sp.]